MKIPDKQDKGTNVGWPPMLTNVKMLTLFEWNTSFCEFQLNGTGTESAPSSSAVILHMKQE